MQEVEFCECQYELLSPDLKTGWLSDRILQNGVSLFENLEIAVESSSEGDVQADFTGFVLLG